MSEERMERKCIARSLPPKAAASDSKKNTDGAYKPWARSSKKREGGGGSSRGDVVRRHVPPARSGPGRSRAGPHPALCREEGSWLESEQAELGSVFVPGSKKQSLNHLLQFTYSPRERPPRAVEPSRRARQSTAHPHHAELFLQASCQFVVKEGVDYGRHLLDPDLPVDWSLVEHVVVRSAGSAECPVCLCEPVAARVTRCGHVYCWACALHYVAVHDKPQPPCPVCHAPLDVTALRSARLRRWQPTPPHEEVVMRLVRRARGSILVELAPELKEDLPARCHYADPFPRWSRHCDLPYAKIVTINTQQVRDIIAEERGQLSQQILDEIDTSELPYLERALELLAAKEKSLEGEGRGGLAAREMGATSAPISVQPTTATDGARVDWWDPDEVEVTDDVARLTLAAEQEEDERQEEMAAAAGGEESLPTVTDTQRVQQANYFYFYQAADGQQVFLHRVDVRLLVTSWGALAAAPRVICGVPLRTESFTVTHQSRRHMPCIAHLPLYCPYDVVELELGPPHVTARALATLADELERRARDRLRAVREERRLERRAAVADRAPPAPHLASLRHFPPARPLSPTPSPPPAANLATTPPGLSFAKMASSSGAWRVRSPRPPSPPLRPPSLEDEEGAAAPRALRLSDAIEAALSAAPAPSPSHNTKKKKNKHKMSLSMGGAAPRLD